jgi:hypothetical protein
MKYITTCIKIYALSVTFGEGAYSLPIPLIEDPKGHKSTAIRDALTQMVSAVVYNNKTECWEVYITLVGVPKPIKVGSILPDSLPACDIVSLKYDPHSASIIGRLIDALLERGVIHEDTFCVSN